jgi:hypothetical protein
MFQQLSLHYHLSTGTKSGDNKCIKKAGAVSIFFA